MDKAPGSGDKDVRKIIEKIVVVFILGYGLHYFGYFIRIRYFNFLEAAGLDDGLSHALGYLGHLFFFGTMMLYAWAVRKDRKYFFAFTKGSAAEKLKFALIGVLLSVALMGTCVFAANMHGDIEIQGSSGGSLPVLLFAAVCVFIQASVEEIESRGFVFGKMNSEGVPFIPAIIASSVFFSYLHAANPGFGIVPFTSIFLVGIMYVLCYHYFGSLWMPMTAHMVWNYMQDFIFGLPDSGKPAAVSFMNTTVKGSSFFYDEEFGIEGSGMTIVMHIVACVVIYLAGRRMEQKRQTA